MLLQGKDHIANMMIDKIGYVGNTIMIIVRKVRLLKELDYSVVASSLSCGVVEISVWVTMHWPSGFSVTLSLYLLNLCTF
jgi:hypothetical protein